MAYSLLSAPAVEPVSVDEAKDYLHITSTDEDAVISRLITTARIWAENYTNRQLITATWALYLDDFAEKIELEKSPVKSIDTISYYDIDNIEQTLTSDYYQVDMITEPAILREASGESWPNTFDKMNAVKITFKAGYGDAAKDVPDDIISAILLIVTFLYENRGDEGHRTMPRSITDLLDFYRVSKFY